MVIEDFNATIYCFFFLCSYMYARNNHMSLREVLKSSKDTKKDQSEAVNERQPTLAKGKITKPQNYRLRRTTTVKHWA